MFCPHRSSCPFVRAGGASFIALLKTLPREGWEQRLVGTATVLGMIPLERPAERNTSGPPEFQLPLGHVNFEMVILYCMSERTGSCSHRKAALLCGYAYYDPCWWLLYVLAE